MGEEYSRTAPPVASEPPTEGRLLVEWLSQQPLESQGQLTQLKLHNFLEQASQPRHASGNACIKLCYYIECVRASPSAHIRDIAFTRETCLDLFNFYVEWNEKNQNRSMRQVLELLSSLIARNPDELTSEAVKKAVLARNLSIITHQTAQSLVKPAFKVLECFLNKKTVTPKELLEAYKIYIFQHGASHGTETHSDEKLWDAFILGVFDWMVLPDVSPAAGKFLVTLFKELKPTAGSSEEHLGDYSTLWQRWIRNGLAKDSQTFENVKNYLFPPLFKIDRPGSLAFLESLNQQKPISALQGQHVDAHSLLQLAAMDVGKKAGLVEEPGTIQFQKAGSKKPAACIVLQEGPIGKLMCSFSDTVRSLAFSVLVSSASSIRPFSPVALDLFQSYLSILYSDTDAKFRNETLTNTKHMIERIRGAMAFLVRELELVSFKLQQGDKAQQALYDGTKLLLIKHEHFVKWYLNFLLGELIPTASYQRHITSLKAITIIIQSEIIEKSSENSAVKSPANSTVWPFKLDFFTSRSMRLLLDLIMDPFEDVRIAASEILALAPQNRFASTTHEASSEGIKHSNASTDDPSTQAASQAPAQHMNNLRLDLLLDYINRAKDASRRTGRADYADGVARSFKILYGLQTLREDKIALLEELVHESELKVDVAREDLVRAVVEAPVHANFATLNLVWEQINPSLDVLTKEPGGWEKWIDFVQRMVSSCLGIWEAVQDVLCNDSPEGHLPQELDELDAIDTKDILSYSFRAIHESSNLMRTIVNKLHQEQPDNIRELANKSFADIGNLTFVQLSTLRHRGAFSTVSLTFAACCQLTQHISSGSQSEISRLLRSWWKGTFDAIHSQASTTRRSAGIPALITGIMSANAPNPNSEEIMADLKLQAKSSTNVISAAAESPDAQLPQVHALNGLREIFKDSAVRRRAEKHVLDCLHIASDALNSEIWAIRNCGLLLFQSLINYLLGTQSKEKTEAGWDGGAKAIFYEKYPNLGELLLHLLDAAAGSDSGDAFSNAIETIFPVLDILRRAGPPEEFQEQILTRLLSTIGHKIWHIRDLSARTFCVLTPKYRWIDAVRRLLKSFGNHAEETTTENQRHGALLAAKLLLERYLPECDFSSHNIDQDLTSLLEVSLALNPKTLRSPFGLAALIDLQNNILAHILSASSKSNNTFSGSESLTALVRSSIPRPGNSYIHLENLLRECDCPRGPLTQTSITGQAHVLAFKKAVYVSALEQDVSTLRDIVKLSSSSYGIETLISILECIYEVWISDQADDVLYKLAGILIAALEEPVSANAPGVRAVALNDLCSIYDSVKDLGSKLFRSTVLQLNHVLAIAAETKLPVSPSLEIAQIRISGISILSEILSHDSLREDTKSKIKYWGMCLRDACRDEKDFDTRYAAGQSLQSLFKNGGIKHIFGEECILEPLLVLYNSLIDDDEEIREIGATTISSLTGKLSTPLQARRDMETWMAEKYNSSLTFTSKVVKRMTGEDALAQITRSLNQDDSLFVEESLNLFIDDVRELKSWVSIFHQLLGTTITEVNNGNSPLTALASWVTGGLGTITTVLSKDGGPLGCISKPSTYFACLRVMIVTNAFLDFVVTHCQDSQPPQDLNIENVLLLFKNLVTETLRTRTHEDLLFEILGPESLTKFETFYSLEVTGIWEKAVASTSPRWTTSFTARK